MLGRLERTADLARYGAPLCLVRCNVAATVSVSHCPFESAAAAYGDSTSEKE